jgi:hypothetical protein
MQPFAVEQIDRAGLTLSPFLAEQVGELALYMEAGHLAALNQGANLRPTLVGLPARQFCWDMPAKGVAMLFDGVMNSPLDEEP